MLLNKSLVQLTRQQSLLPMRQSLMIASMVPQRNVMMHWLPKYRTLYKPQYYDNPERRWDTALKRKTYSYVTQDPLYFEHHSKHTNGGIQVYIDHCHDQNKYNVPLKQMAYIMYNMVQDNIYDPSVFENFEKHYRTVSSKHMSGRVAFGALWAYLKGNQGTLYGVDFWTSKLEDNITDMRVMEVSRLGEAFRDNRQLPRSFFRDMLDKQLKTNVILPYWDKEVRFNQRTLFDLARELDHIMWYDEEVWTKIFDTAVEKKKINNSHDFKLVHNLMVKLNTQADEYCGHLNGKFDDQIAKLLERHYTEDRKWKYNAETGELYTLAEMRAKRDDSRPEHHVVTKSEVDEATIIQAREAEKKLKRLKMAKYSHELFDEIIEEMMREKKTILEMMAELDAAEADIYESQTRIAKRQQTKIIEEQMAKEGKIKK